METTENLETAISDAEEAPATEQGEEPINEMYFKLAPEIARVRDSGPGTFPFELGESLGLWGKEKQYHRDTFRMSAPLRRALSQKKLVPFPFLQALEEIALCAPEEIRRYCELEVQTRLVYFMPLLSSFLTARQMDILRGTRKLPKLRPDIWKMIARVILLHKGDAKDRASFILAALATNPNFPKKINLDGVRGKRDAQGGQIFYVVTHDEAVEYLQLFHTTMAYYEVPQYKMCKILEHMVKFVNLPGGGTDQEAIEIAMSLILKGELGFRVSFGKR